jgi:hypothetical protein
VKSREFEIGNLRFEIETRLEAKIGSQDRKQGRKKEKKMQCEQFEQILEQQDAAELSEASRTHLEGCEACRTLSADFSAIRDAALELGDEEIAPPERVWVSLRNQLEAEGLIHGAEEIPQAAREEHHGWWAVFQRPAVAGAFLGAVLVAASSVGYLSNFATAPVDSQLKIQQEASPVPAADSVFKEEVLTVGNESVPGLQREDTVVTNSIRQNLQIVDNLIAICEKSVREQPDNEMAREYLYGAYQQKAELLATATNRSMTGGLQ